MPIEERLGEQGSFSVDFENIPDDVYRRIDQFDHVLIVSPKIDLDLIEDPLPLSEYTGTILDKDLTGSPRISGAGLIRHLGDENDIADYSEADIVLHNDTFEDAINEVLPPAIVAGTIHSQAPKTITATFPALEETPRQQLNKVMTEFGTEYRITPQGYLDAGTPEHLYETTTEPKCILLPRTKAEGQDPTMRAIAIAEASQRNDRRGYATRVILAAQNEADSTIAIAAADLDPPTTFKDLHGNPLVRKKIISESSTDGGLAPTRALAHLVTAAALRRELSISTEDYEARSMGDTGPGAYKVGDTVWAYDSLSDLQDPENEVIFRNERWQATTIRIVGTDRPRPKDSSTLIRHKDGTYTDVTEWAAPEDGPTQITVGAFGRPLVGDPNEQLGPRITADSSVPAIPVFSPFVSDVYQDDNGVDRGSITASWSTPANTDSTAIVDGATYTVGWKRAGTGVYQFVDVPWGTNTVMIQDLPIAVSFDFIIQASDAAKPPNRSGFSAVSTVVAGTDISAPGIPAAPTVAGGILKIRVLHTLGLASGGTFNLEADLDHLNVYADTTAGFTPGPGNFKGHIVATKTHMALGIEVLGDFDMDDDTARWVRVTAVDHSGNESDPSAAATATAGLLQDQHIESVSAGKLTAGIVNVSIELNAAAINGGVITGGIVQTALSGQRVALSEDWTDQIRFYTGDASETNWGQVGSFVTGSGGSRKLSQYVRTAMFTSQKWAMLEMNSGSQDGTTPGSVVLSVRDVSDLVGYLSITPNVVDLNAVTAGGRLVIDANMALLQSPDEFWIRGATTADVSLLGTAGRVHVRNFLGTAWRGITADGFAHSNPPNITGDGAGNAGLYNLLNALDTMGLINNSVT